MITQPENQPQERVQAIRSVYKTITPNTTASIATTESEVVHVTVYLDPAGRDIVFWEDILFAFKDALNVRRGTHVLPLLRGSNYKLIEPHCIAAVPNAVLDVYIGEPSTQPAADQNSRLVHPSPPPSHSLTQVVSLSEETVQHLCKTMASTLAKEFNISLKTVSAPLQASSDDTVDLVIKTKSLNNDSSSVQAKTSDDTSQQYGRQSTNAQRERNNIESTSQSSTKVHTESDDKENTKAPGIAPSKQERPGSIGSSTETMSKRMAEIAAKARQGDAESQYQLAEAYKTGSDGLSCSDEAAIDWYIKAGNQGHGEAQIRMGMYYKEGFSVPKDYVKAMEWWLKAANQGYSHAQLNVGLIYYDGGEGICMNKNLAMEWYLKAANGGSIMARHLYGNLKEHANRH